MLIDDCVPGRSLGKLVIPFCTDQKPKKEPKQMKMQRSELLSILNKVWPGLGSEGMIESLSNFQFGNGYVVSYNDEVLVSHPGCTGLNGVVDSRKLLSLLSKSSDDDIDVETTETELLVRGCTMEAGIILQAEISERIKVVVAELTAEDHQWKSLPKDFAEVVQQVIFAAGQDMTKPLLTCVHVTSQYAETCDNYRMARVAFPKRVQIKDLLLPARMIQNISQYAPTQYAEGNGWIHFKNGDGVQFSCRTMEGQYPELSKLLEVEGLTIEFPENIFGALERSGVFLDDFVMGSKVCSIRLSEGVLEISAKGVSGWIKEQLDVKYKGDVVKFQVLPKVLQSILKRCLSAVIGSGSILFKGDGFSYCCAITVEK